MDKENSFSQTSTFPLLLLVFLSGPTGGKLTRSVRQLGSQDNFPILLYFETFVSIRSSSARLSGTCYCMTWMEQSEWHVEANLWSYEGEKIFRFVWVSGSFLLQTTIIVCETMWCAGTPNVHVYMHAMSSWYYDLFVILVYSTYICCQIYSVWPCTKMSQ